MGGVKSSLLWQVGWEGALEEHPLLLTSADNFR